MTTTTSVEVPMIDLGGSLIGFPQAHNFALVRLTADSEVLFRLTALDVAGLEFVAAAPYPFFPDYAPEIDDATAARLDLVDARDALLLVLLTVGPNLASTTANLFAPIVVNIRTRRAAQVTLASAGYSLKEPLTRRPARASDATDLLRPACPAVGAPRHADQTATRRVG